MKPWTSPPILVCDKMESGLNAEIRLMVQSILDGYAKDILIHEHSQNLDMNVQEDIPLHEIHVVNIVHR